MSCHAASPYRNSNSSTAQRQNEKLRNLSSSTVKGFKKKKDVYENMRHTIKKLQTVIDNSSLHTEILKDLFTPDQIRYLEIKKRGGKKISKWSTATVKKALQTKFACGNNGLQKSFVKTGLYHL